MNRILLIIVAVVLTGAALVYAITRDNNTQDTGMNMAKATSSSDSQSKSQPVSTSQISIQNYSFTPAAISIKAGTVVTWTNDDTVPHTVVVDGSQTGPHSPELAPGKSYTFTFTQTGIYHYHCSLHPSMTGTVTVS